MSGNADKRLASQRRRRWFTHPTLTVTIAIGWLLLQHSLALPQLITAVVLGFWLPWLIDAFLDPVVRPRNPKVMLRLLGIVVRDIVESNLTVARLVLSPSANPQPGWLRVPMDIHHPVGQLLLGSIITNTPGTVTCKIDEDAQEIYVHVLDCGDPDELIAHIKQRYEKPLMEILE
ncbi:Na+/H+ antiporter subunit E [Piscinibacter sakaiensis]|uniref:Na+/H+ antiporter subunit E n=1 Tax=Piscinibacter sakaiensis TaxID=1547922 RepID=UPI003AAC7348